jgi:hypothetical protein
MRKLLMIIMLLCSFGTAFAQDKKPDYLSPFINNNEPMGHATYRKLFIKVYEASLWSDAENIDYSRYFALSLTYAVSIDVNDFVDRTIEEMAKVTHMPQKNLDFYRPQLQRVMRDVKSGDTITALNIPGKGVKFFYNGVSTGQIDGAEFSERF